MSPRSVRLFALLLLVPLVAGCADGHDHADGGHGGASASEPTLLVGVDNQGSRDLAVRVTLTAPNGTLVWDENFTAGAGALPEKVRALGGEGIFTLDLVYSWSAPNGQTAEGSDRALVDTAECGGITHLTFVVDTTDGIEKKDTHRECHEE